MKTAKIRLIAAITAAILLATECVIGAAGTGWIRSYFGDVLVIPLIYALWRVIAPRKPAPGWKLPTGILAFAFAVEFLQLLGAAEWFAPAGAVGDLVRIIIGTSFSVIDLLCYTAGAIPLYLIEQRVKLHSNRKNQQNGNLTRP